MLYAFGRGSRRTCLVTLLVLALCLTVGLSLQVTRAASASAADMSDYSSVRAVLVDLDGNIKIRSTVASLPQGAIDTTVKNNNLTCYVSGHR